MLRRRLVALGLGLPVLMAAAAACTDDGSKGSGGSASADPVARGQALSRTKGCSACHGANGEGGLGPGWTDAMGSTVTLSDGSQVVVDEAYLRRSIEDPQAQVVDGYSVQMPKQQLTPPEVDDLVAYITSLSRSG